MLGHMANGDNAMPGAGGRRALWYSGFAVYAAGVALFSGPGLDHWWGAWAAGGYAIAALVTVVPRGGAWGARLAIAASLAGALAAPTLWLMTKEPTPPDVAVVARSGVLLLHHGTPYLPVAALSAGGWLAYNPYLPVMALFGLPGALGLPGKTWPWLIAGRSCCCTRRSWSRSRRGRTAGGARALGHAAFWLACPVMAFPLTMGITDPPVIALTCLALALLATEPARALDDRARRSDTVLAALVLGVACAMKYTAWPALAIIAVMVAARNGARSAVRFTGWCSRPPPRWWRRSRRPRCATRRRSCRTRWPTRSGLPRRSRPRRARCPATCSRRSGPAGTSPRSCCSRRPGWPPRPRW